MISLERMRDELGGWGYPLKEINLEYVHKKARESQEYIVQERLKAQARVIRMVVMGKLRAYGAPEDLDIEMMEYFDSIGGTALTISEEEAAIMAIIKKGGTIKENQREDQ